MPFLFAIDWCVLRKDFHHSTSNPVQPQTDLLISASVFLRQPLVSSVFQDAGKLHKCCHYILHLAKKIITYYQMPHI